MTARKGVAGSRFKGRFDRSKGGIQNPWAGYAQGNLCTLDNGTGNKIIEKREVCQCFINAPVQYAQNRKQNCYFSAVRDVSENNIKCFRTVITDKF